MKYFYCLSLFLWCVLSTSIPKVYVVNPIENQFTDRSDLVLSIENLKVYVQNQVPENFLKSGQIQIPVLPEKVLIALKRQVHDLDGLDASAIWSKSIHRVIGDEIVVEHEDLILAHVNAAEWEDSLRALISPMTQIIPSSDLLPLVKFSSSLPKGHVLNRRIDALTFNPNVSNLLEIMEISSIEKNIKFLTGEDETSFIYSRNSKHPSIHKVAHWIGDRMKQMGCPNVTYFDFKVNYGPNVICTFLGKKDPRKLVIMGAHYDSREEFLDVERRAPGADDDGSGTGAILEAVRVFSSPNLELDYTVQLVTFCGEEQGLYGSLGYSSFLQRNNADVIAMIQNDMLGYRKPGEEYQIGFPRAPGFASAEMNTLLMKVASLYMPILKLGYTSACCSDHYYFHKLGFPASASFERMGPIADPMYHNVGDRTDRVGYDFKQIVLIGRYCVIITFRAIVASVLVIAKEW